MTNFKTHISHERFDQEKLITERLLFTIRIAHSKAETQEHPTFGQYVFKKQYKSIDKGNKRSSKEAVTINDVRSFNNRVHS